MKRHGTDAMVERIERDGIPRTVPCTRPDELSVHVVGYLERRPLATDHMEIIERTLQFLYIVPALQCGVGVHVEIMVYKRTVPPFLIKTARIVILKYIDFKSVQERIGDRFAVHPERRPPAVLLCELETSLEIPVQERWTRPYGPRLESFAVLFVIDTDYKIAILYLHMLQLRDAPCLPFCKIKTATVEIV